MEVKKVAVLGAGNGGMTAAAEIKERGIDTTLYELPQFAKNLETIKEKGGILNDGYNTPVACNIDGTGC